MTPPASGLAPLDDPAYRPAHPPVDGLPRDIIARWGARSQLRWFDRFRGQLRGAPIGFWARFYCSSDTHRGSCCFSCIEDKFTGYGDDITGCCCRSEDDD
jgi:hypothetical protein